MSNPLVSGLHDDGHDATRLWKCRNKSRSTSTWACAAGELVTLAGVRAPEAISRNHSGCCRVAPVYQELLAFCFSP